MAWIALSPDNVAFPLARAARVYVGEQELRAALDFRRRPPPTSRCSGSTIPRAPTSPWRRRARRSFGIGSLSFVTREGVRVLLDQAAGIVIALLVAFSLVALLAAGDDARGERPRRGPAAAGGDRGPARARLHPGRDRGAPRASRRRWSRCPPRRAGIAVGALAVAEALGPLLGALNEQAPGASLALPLLAGLAAVVALVTAAATWPAWRAARRPPAAILRGGDLAGAAPVARPGEPVCSRSEPASRSRRAGAGWPPCSPSRSARAW